MEPTVSQNGAPFTFDTNFVLELRKPKAKMALSQLFDHYWQPLFQLSYNLLRNDDDAKDAVQEVFIKLWDRRFEIDIQTSVESYLFSAVRYRSLTMLSKRLAANKREVSLEHYIEQTFLEAIDPLLLKELEQEIDTQISQLPNRMQEVIRLKTKEGLSISEIAVRLNISEETVKNHLASARKRLRTHLRDVAYVILAISTTYPPS
ncbi:RNA polymerase sigma-70 factor (ECF subfamily) [Sphingobacterium allocomposti]|uniref:RNA polymerase sigma-70 factor (ECF subfamily) n=1 Tax=Sphingobacterium allocomposti TaxID=415956 RepID=A0A5S5DC81_9SPHI|nr:sigma-70 family RNA polymerase sigma factor [Sphingobacterium composti Yoo et al. 2007 non Ten et al. 2007]TYP92312.1 RNA polymerase sigma-70 factor (ECF subfamily) [Sphingobacterium composti Yoo et al. 2007 non Ten et al. 2007]